MVPAGRKGGLGRGAPGRQHASGYAIWENMRPTVALKRRVSTPTFLSSSRSASWKEAEHVDGFAKDRAVVTHHRLEEGPDGGLQLGVSEEPLVVRPTATIIGAMFSKGSVLRDLPILINQWANVVRWSLGNRTFLRTAESSGKRVTVHATADEAIEETRHVNAYAEAAETQMAMPVIKVRRPSPSASRARSRPRLRR